MSIFKDDGTTPAGRLIKLVRQMREKGGASGDYLTRMVAYAAEELTADPDFNEWAEDPNGFVIRRITLSYRQDRVTKWIDVAANGVHVASFASFDEVVRYLSDPEQDDEDPTLGPCGCVDYHQADCPTLTYPVHESELDGTAWYSPNPGHGPHPADMEGGW